MHKCNGEIEMKSSDKIASPQAVGQTSEQDGIH